jgi:membrane protein DedA with SNARE-associated domain
MGYLGVFLTMTLVFTFFPFPSQLVLIPAGFLASQGQMSLTLLILSGTIGGVLGAHINYQLANRLGRRVILRYGRYVMVSEAGLHRAELFFDRYGQFSIFIGLISPAIGQLITLPAGLAAMHRIRFLASVAGGSLVWNCMMIFLGFYFGEHQTFIAEHWGKLMLALLGSIIAIVALYVCIKRGCLVAEKSP